MLSICRHVKDRDMLFAYNLLIEISAPYKARMHLLICWICESSSCPNGHGCSAFHKQAQSYGIVGTTVFYFFLATTYCTYIPHLQV